MVYSIILNVLLVLIIFISIKMSIKQIKKYKETVDSLKFEMKKLEELMRIKNEIEKKKDKINTGDNVNDFNNSLDLLHQYSKLRN